MVAGPEVSRVVAAYETMSCVKDASITTEHHDQNASTQTTFVEKVGALERVLKEMGNPFQEETADLLVLETLFFVFDGIGLHLRQDISSLA